MSNSSRIEPATRQYIGATLTTDHIQQLIKLADPNDNKPVYPSDCAGKRMEDGTLTHRGKQAYGDIILEFLGPNSYRVLAADEIVRRKHSKAAKTPLPPPTVPAGSGSVPPGFVDEKPVITPVITTGSAHEATKKLKKTA